MFRIVVINIINSLKGYRIAYVGMIISQLTAILILFFVYGIYSSFNAEKQELDAESYEIKAQFGNKDVAGKLKECIPEILESVEHSLDYFVIRGNDGDNRIFVYNEYHDGKYYLSETVYRYKAMKDGRLINPDEISNGSKVIHGVNLGKVGDKFIIAGEEFEVVGLVDSKGAEINGMPAAHISLTAFPDSISLDWIVLLFNKLPTKDEYMIFKNTLEEKFGDNVVVDEFKIKDEEELIAIHSVIIMSVAIGIIAAFNTALLYGYIVKKRKKQMAIYGIVGASRLERILINEIEIVLVSICTCVIGMLIFKFGFEKQIMEIYDNSVSIYNSKVYMLMSGIYFVSVTVTNLIVTLYNSRKNFLDAWRGRNA